MLATAALLLHAATEIPAAVTFLFFPEKQLATDGKPVPLETALVLQNLGGLLASSAVLSLVLAIWGSPQHISPGLRGSLCLCLAIYHVFPVRRAYIRIGAGRKDKNKNKNKNKSDKTLGGPAVHLAVHIACLGLLVLAGLAGIQSR